MDKWNALELLILGVILFAYFAPVVYTTPSYSNCVFSPSVTSMCPNEAAYYASLTYAALGHGATYLGGFYSISW